MNLLRYLEKRIRGWLPKELSLPRNQRTSMVNHFMRLQLLRLAYGVMLGALLFTPFGVYHSRVEPYITGYLLGYNLPIGYVGVLLGIVAVLYPRLNALRRLSFSSFMPFIGLFLLFSFFFSPKDYFINLIHGTNFSSVQIDVDFALGNSAVLGLSLLSIVVGLISFFVRYPRKEATDKSEELKPVNRKDMGKPIRGWFPQDAPILYAHKMAKPIWWKPLWMATVLLTVASGAIGYFVLQVPLERVALLLFLTFFCIGIAYYIRVKSSIKVNRALYILLGITPLGFVLSVAYAFFIGRYVTGWLWGWFNIIVTVGILITGAFIGDWLGKRRNYQLPLSP
jgi:MFS family permease